MRFAFSHKLGYTQSRLFTSSESPQVCIDLLGELVPLLELWRLERWARMLDGSEAGQFISAGRALEGYSGWPVWAGR